jgi:hypothetical protein
MVLAGTWRPLAASIARPLYDRIVLPSVIPQLVPNNGMAALRAAIAAQSGMRCDDGPTWRSAGSHGNVADPAVPSPERWFRTARMLGRDAFLAVTLDLIGKYSFQR